MGSDNNWITQKKLGEYFVKNSRDIGVFLTSCGLKLPYNNVSDEAFNNGFVKNFGDSVNPYFKWNKDKVIEHLLKNTSLKLATDSEIEDMKFSEKGKIAVGDLKFTFNILGVNNVFTPERIMDVSFHGFGELNDKTFKKVFYLNRYLLANKHLKKTLGSLLYNEMLLFCDYYLENEGEILNFCQSFNENE